MEKLPIVSQDGYMQLDDLPHDCIFNKGRTGCGGTSIVLRNNECYVIAVPITELIVSKLFPKLDYEGKPITYDSVEIKAGISPDGAIIGLYGSFDVRLKRELKNYLNQEGAKKILCTYDKLPLLAKYINTKDYRLLIDEYHTLLKQYSFRDEAIDGVFDVFRDYKSFCFMSATPILPNFKPNVLEGVKEYVADWDTQEIKRVILNQTNKPYNAMTNILNRYKILGEIELVGKDEEKHFSKEAYVFINSVQDIKNIVANLHLSNDECRIICADNDSNRKKLAPYTISNSTDEPKMFNFITSKAFEGVDFHSETGLCFVVSSAYNKNTLVDISTDIPQIAGRIRNRNNPFHNCVVHIFNKTYENVDATFEDIKASMDRQLEIANERVNAYNKLSEDAKKQTREELEKATNASYIRFDKSSNRFVVNDRKAKFDLYDYNVKKAIYQSTKSIRDTYKQQKDIITSFAWQRIDDKSVKNIVSKISFKEAFEKYELLQNSFRFDDSAIIELEGLYPFIRDAYHVLGVDEVKSLKYTQSKIKDAIINHDKNRKDNDKIHDMLKERFVVGEFRPSAYYIKYIKEAFTVLGYPTDKVKPIDVKKWFDIQGEKGVTKRYNGKPTYGFIITGSKLIYEE